MNGGVAFAGDGRGQTGIIGAVLIIALVFIAALAVVATGSTTLGLAQEERSQEEAQLTMESVDGDLTRLTTSGRTAQARFSLRQIDSHESQLVRNGHVNVTVNRNATCSTEIPLSSVRYESESGEVVAYEAGGVWTDRRNDTGGAMQSEPDLGYRNGSIEVTVTNMTGTVSDSENLAFYNATNTTVESTRRSQQLLTGRCSRLNNVTIEVQSDFYRGWSTHLEDEFGVETETFESNRTTVVHLGQNRLPPRVNLSRNRVINFSNATYVENVSIRNNTIRITKNNSREYSATVSALSEQRLDIGRVDQVAGTTALASPERDFVFVIDESGSMYADDAGGGTRRYQAAQDATQAAVGTLNESRDRAGLVGYSYSWWPYYWGVPDWGDRHNYAWIYNTSSEALTDSFDDFNDTVDDTSTIGGTPGSVAIYTGTQLLHTGSNQSRDRVMVLLTDGQFNVNDYPDPAFDRYDRSDSREAARRRAQQAAQADITIYTVGFGGDANNTLLRQIADITGGENYTAGNQDELIDVFQNITGQTIPTTDNRIVRTPTSTNVTTDDGEVFPPRLPGGSDGIANTTVGGNQFSNINDPNTGAQFDHSFTLADNESLSFNASTYECDQYEGTGQFRVLNGESYEITRCAEMSSVNRTIPPENVSVYTDGDDLTTLLDDESPAWWQQSIEEAFAQRSDVSLSPSNITSMPSNYALVVLDYPDGTNSTNKLALLYELGISESEYSAEGVIDVRVNDIRVRD